MNEDGFDELVEIARSSVHFSCIPSEGNFVEASEPYCHALRSAHADEGVCLRNIMRHGRQSERGGEPLQTDFRTLAANVYLQSLVAHNASDSEEFNIGRFPLDRFGSLLNNVQISQVGHALRLGQRVGIPLCRN